MILDDLTFNIELPSSANFSIDSGEQIDFETSETPTIIQTGGASSWDDLSGKPFETIGTNLEVVDGKLNVVTTNDAEEDNTKPITSAGTYVILGNINALLETV